MPRFNEPASAYSIRQTARGQSPSHWSLKQACVFAQAKLSGEKQQDNLRYLLKGNPERFAAMCLALKTLGVSTNAVDCNTL